ncbi:MAG: amidohydrolase family protein [Nitrososphaeria archaeon]
MSSLEDYIKELWIYDTHEHVISEDERIRYRVDPFQVFLAHYASSDLMSAGLSIEDFTKVVNTDIPLNDRWKIVEPFWNKAGNTSYFQAIRIAMEDIYGVEEVNEKTIKELSDKMNNENKRGLYRRILKERSKIERSIYDGISDIVDVDREFFAPVVRLEDFIMVRSREDVKKLSRMQGLPIHSLRELERALELRVADLLNKIVGFKIALAYKRSIYFEKVTFNDAEKVFNKIMSSKDTFIRYTNADGVRVTVPDEISIEEGRSLQDYMVHKILQLAAKYELPVQVHTGLQEGNLNLVSNSHPLLLSNLFMEYHDVKFDIFHGSYPFTKELANIAKNLPNVYVDLSWLHVVSPTSAHDILRDLLDTVPANKILGFGGDYRFVEGIYAHSKMARAHIAQVLREKVDRGRFTEDEAKNIAKRMLRDNVIDVFTKVKV